MLMYANIYCATVPSAKIKSHKHFKNEYYFGSKILVMSVHSLVICAWLMVAAQPGHVCLIPVAYGSSTAWSCVLLSL